MHTGEKPHKIRNRVSSKLMSGDVRTYKCTMSEIRVYNDSMNLKKKYIK